MGIIYNCYSHDNTGDGLEARRISNGVNTMTDSVFSDNGGDGVRIYGNSTNALKVMVGNIFDNNTGDGIDATNSFSNANARGHFVNNIFTDNGGYGYSSSNSTYTISGIGYNVFYNNTSGACENCSSWIGQQTGNPNFTDAANEDYTINASSSALGNGFDMSDWSGMTGSLNINIGIDQDDNAAGGASVTSGYSYGQ